MRLSLPAATTAAVVAVVVVVLGFAGPARAASPSPSAAPSSAPSAAPSASPDPAAAAELAKAQAEVTDLGAEVDRTTAELTAGTERLEGGRARLAETRARADSARVEADQALARAAEARALLGRVVNAGYRTVRTDALTRALSSNPSQLRDTVLADAELDHVRGNQNDALQVASAAGARAQELVREAERLQQDAEAQARDLETEVGQLAAQAQQTRARLEAAAARLAAAQIADQAAREAAARQTLIDISGGAALCTAASTAGYPNGFLPPEVLCPLTVGNGHRLRADAAAAFNAMNAAHPLCVTDSYRSYGAQVDVYARKPGLAAVPGTSNHGLGVAVDLCGGVETFGTAEHAWLQANAARWGWVHPAWAEPGGSRPEPWHWEYVGVPAR